MHRGISITGSIGKELEYDIGIGICSAATPKCNYHQKDQLISARAYLICANAIGNWDPNNGTLYSMFIG